MTLVSADGHELGEGTVGRRRGTGAPKHHRIPAEIRTPRPALGAQATSSCRIHDDAIPESGPDHPRPNGLHGPNQLVSQNEGSAGNKGTAVAVLEIVEIRPANSSPPDPEQHHALSEGRPRTNFRSQVPRAVQDDGLHQGGPHRRVLNSRRFHRNERNCPPTRRRGPPPEGRQGSRSPPPSSLRSRRTTCKPANRNRS